MSLPVKHPYLFTFLLFPVAVNLASGAARKLTELVTGRKAEPAGVGLLAELVKGPP